MNNWRGIHTLIYTGAAVLLLTNLSTAATLDRYYKMGEEAGEGGAPGGSVSLTFDGQGLMGLGQLVDLTAVNTPTYVTISGRPDGGGGSSLGIQFNAAQSEYLHGFNLGFPEDSFSAATHTTLSGGSLNYLGISNRGFQFWARPTSTTVQTLVMDTNQHGVRINSNGKFSMRYAGVDVESTLTATANTWYHIEVVRPAGAGNGARMYINGNAVAAASGGYNDDWADLTVGANTAGDDGGVHGPPAVGFTGGTSEFYSGIIDDLKMFVIGTSTAPGSVNYGTFNPFVDNDFIASTVTGIKGIAGDVNNNGSLEPTDKTAFINAWMDPRIVNGFQLGDMTSRVGGDFNLDGITDIQDLLVFQNALSAAGMSTLTAADFAGVPEPSTTLLALAALALTTAASRRRTRPRN